MASLLAEMAVSAARDALTQAKLDPPDVNLVICAASKLERAYPMSGFNLGKGDQLMALLREGISEPFGTGA